MHPKNASIIDINFFNVFYSLYKKCESKSTNIGERLNKTAAKDKDKKLTLSLKNIFTPSIPIKAADINMNMSFKCIFINDLLYKNIDTNIITDAVTAFEDTIVILFIDNSVDFLINIPVAPHSMPASIGKIGTIFLSII